jgi:hypothetical protein
MRTLTFCSKLSFVTPPYVPLRGCGSLLCVRCVSKHLPLTCSAPLLLPQVAALRRLGFDYVFGGCLVPHTCLQFISPALLGSSAGSLIPCRIRPVAAQPCAASPSAASQWCASAVLACTLHTPLSLPTVPPLADTLAGADLTIMEEGHELLERLEGLVSRRADAAPLPMFTSCCPGWVGFVETCAPELIPHISTCKSPHMMVGAVLKTYFAEVVAGAAGTGLRRRGSVPAPWVSSLRLVSGPGLGLLRSPASLLPPAFHAAEDWQAGRGAQRGERDAVRAQAGRGGPHDVPHPGGHRTVGLGHGVGAASLGATPRFLHVLPIRASVEALTLYRLAAAAARWTTSSPPRSWPGCARTRA